MIKNVFTREGKVRQQRRTVSYKLHSTSVILYFSVFLSASTRLLELNCIDYICPLMLVTQIHFLRSTNDGQ